LEKDNISVRLIMAMEMFGKKIMDMASKSFKRAQGGELNKIGTRG
jgi:hypothetical protein